MSSYITKQTTDAQRAQRDYQYEKPGKRATKLESDNDLIQELLSEAPSVDDRSDDGLDDEYDASKTPIIRQRNASEGSMRANAANLDDIIPQYNIQGGSEQIHSLTLNFIRSSTFSYEQLVKWADLIKVDKEKIKIVKLQFRRCVHLNDADLEHLGAVFGSRLGHVEYLYIDFWRCRRATYYGIQKLIQGISGNVNSVKSLRLRLRMCWNVGNKSVQPLVGGIRSVLINLEELLVILAGNIWLTGKGIKALREGGYGQGLNKYEIRHHWTNLMGMIKDDSAKDMTRYIKKMLAEKDVIEGSLVSNKMTFFFKHVWSNKVNTCKVDLESQGDKKCL